MSKRNVSSVAMAAAGCLFLGAIAGIMVPRELLPFHAQPPVAEAENEADDDGAEDVFDVTLTAQASMGLKRGYAERRDFVREILVPGSIQERPAVSNLQASSKLAGIVRRIYVDVGQSVREGDRLFEIELTGEGLAESQSVLLDANKQLEIVRSEIERVRPIAASGGVARKNLLEKEYEEKRLRSIVAAKEQELLVKGLTREQLTEMLAGGSLVRTITVRVPEGIRPIDDVPKSTFGQVPASQKFVSLESDDAWVYSIEKLYVNPGSMAAAGQTLCDLAFHESLQMVGQAFEADVPVLTECIKSRQPISVVVGDDSNPYRIDDLAVLYIDNHLDPESLTVQFFIELKNEVMSETTNTNGALFRSWRLRPDQRGHVRLPAETWRSKLVLPADAVATDGLDNVIFLHLGEHRPIGEAAHSEFRKVPVVVRYKDRQHCVVEANTNFDENTEIALNHAFLLQLQSSRTEGGGGHHHHDH